MILRAKFYIDRFFRERYASGGCLLTLFWQRRFFMKILGKVAQTILAILCAGAFGVAAIYASYAHVCGENSAWLPWEDRVSVGTGADCLR